MCRCTSGDITALLNVVIIYQILQEAAVTEIATIAMSFLIHLEESADHEVLT